MGKINSLTVMIIVFYFGTCFGMDLMLDYSKLLTNKFKENVESLLSQYDDLSGLKGTSPLLNHRLYYDKSVAYLLPQLLEKKANPNVIKSIPGRHYREECPLYLSIFHNDKVAAECLLNAGANSNIVADSSSPLLKTISRGNDEMLNLLLRYDANPNMQIPSTGQIALLGAVKYGLLNVEKRSDLIRILLGNGAYIIGNDYDIIASSKQVYQEYLQGFYNEKERFEYRKAARILVRYMLLEKMLHTEFPAEIADIVLRYENSPPYAEIPNNFSIKKQLLGKRKNRI